MCAKCSGPSDHDCTACQAGLFIQGTVGECKNFDSEYVLWVFIAIGGLVFCLLVMMCWHCHRKAKEDKLRLVQATMVRTPEKVTLNTPLQKSRTRASVFIRQVSSVNRNFGNKIMPIDHGRRKSKQFWGVDQLGLPGNPGFDGVSPILRSSRDILSSNRGSSRNLNPATLPYTTNKSKSTFGPPQPEASTSGGSGSDVQPVNPDPETPPTSNVISEKIEPIPSKTVEAGSVN